MFEYDPVMCGRLKNRETLCNLECLFSHLSKVQSRELTEMIREYLVLFGDIPSHTHLIEHDIDVGDSAPFKQRFYRCTPHKQEVMAAEVKYMLDNNIAVPSSSSWASPCLLVDKSDKSPRFCTDYEK